MPSARTFPTMLLIGALASAALGPATGVRADCDTPRPPVVVREGFVNLASVPGFGFSVALDRQTLAVSDPWARPDAVIAGRVGAVQIMRRGGTGWAVETVKYGAVSTARRAGLGLCVAVEGDLAAASRPDAVEVWEREVGADGEVVWASAGVLAVPRAGGVHIDGGVVYVCADNSPTDAADGSVVEARRDAMSPGGWTQRTVLSGLRVSPLSGTSQVQVRGDTMVVADCGSTNPRFVRGSDVRVYRRAGAEWALESSLPGRTLPPSTCDGFGFGLSVEEDRVAVGANWEPGGTRSGYARVFRREVSGGGATWVLETELEHPTISGYPPRTGYGISVALRGERLLVGSTHDPFSGPGAGAVFAYMRSGSAWSPVGSYTLADSAGAWVGWQTALVGEEIVAGALGLDGIGGAVVFDACSLTGGPGGSTPRCLPGVLGLLTFAQAYFSGEPFADYDRSGSLSIQDFLDFLTDWFAGCP